MAEEDPQTCGVCRFIFNKGIYKF